MVNTPVKFIEYIRDGLVEQEHFGLAVKVSNNGDVEKIGEDKNYPFYLRSCAKPLQASLVIDYKLDEIYNLTLEEIAICCASHAGENCHVETAERLLKKIGLSEDALKCGLHKPLSRTEKNKLLLSGDSENIFQNNCSGKHIMMLALCKSKGWNLDNYDEVHHPLQSAIKNKIYELCELNQNYPITKDGCGVPIHSMPLENMVRGYLNLFCDKRYSKIKKGFLYNPYLIGGEDRLDTAIMGVNDKLISKVGAGGLCIVVNLEKEEAIIVKIMNCDMKARAISLISLLKSENWLTDDMLNNELIENQNKTDILTLHGEKIGNINCLVQF